MNSQYSPGGFSLLPVVVKNLLIINGIFFFATVVFQSSLGFDLVDTLGLHYFTAEKFKPFQLITYMFMHGNFAHIFSNMFALWLFGSVLENYWGKARFLQYYIICGVGAAITHYAIFYFESRSVLSIIDAYIQSPNVSNFNLVFESLPRLSGASVQLKEILNSLGSATSDSEQLQISVDFLTQYKIDYLNSPVIVGASGAVFALLLAFGMMFPNSYVYVYFFIPMKAKYFVILYGAIELFSGISNNSGDNVAHFAHLGGMLFGFILIKYWQSKINRYHS